MGPLSAKQHREYLKLDADEQRKNAAFTQEQQRKDQLHQLKLKEAGAKASQGIAHKEENHAMKLAEGTMKVPRINRQKLGLPSMNPLADSEVLGQGQRRLPGMTPKGTDTVPAMLTPGEAVIPAPAAQNPKNKKAIKKMVQEGRKKNNIMGYADGTEYVQEQVQPLTIQDPRMGYTAPMYEGKYIENIPTRSNNPGNLMYAGQANAIPGVPKPGGGSFALFANPQAGVEALERQVTKNTQERGQNIKQMMAKYAPKGENNTAKYVKNLSKEIGISPTAKVPMDKVPALSRAISKFEGYKGEYYADGTTGVKYYNDGNVSVPFDATTQEIPVYVPQLSLGTPAPDLRLLTNAVPINTAVPVTVAPLANTGQEAALTVAERHNNPGNLIFVGQKGAVKGEPKAGGGYWARFETPESGRQALENQIKLDTQERGLTLFDTMNKYAPAGDRNNPSAYAKTIGDKLGISLSDKVPADKIGLMADVITSVESGGKYKTNNNVVASKLTPAESDELATLKKVVSSNIYPANEVGKARMRIQELEGKALSVPKPQATPEQKQWADERRGTVKPDVAQRVAAIDAMVPAAVLPANEGNVPSAVMPPQLPEAPSVSQEVPKDTAAFDAMIAGFSQQVAPQIQEAAKEAEKIVDPVEKKTFLENFIANIYGTKSSLFNERDLSRFAVLAAGGLLTGGSVGGSLKFAAKDTLINADKRNTVQAQQDFEREKIKAVDDRTERNKLIDQGYEPANIDKYLKSRTINDLGSPKTTYSFKETGKQYTIDRGPQSGMVFQVVEATTKTGKGAGDTIQMIIDPRTNNKVPLSSFQANAQKLGYNVVDYSSATHSPTAKANRVKEWVEKDANTIADQALEQVYGASKVKDKPNTARANVPTSSAMGAQAASFFKSIGFEPSDSGEMLEGKNIMNVAVQDMINDQQTRKVKVTDITPYLSRSMITVRSGINPDLFKIGAGDKAKVMPPEKIVQLDYLVKQASSNLGGNQTNAASQQALYQKMATAWTNNPKLREQYAKPGPEESSFYMFMKDTLSKGLKQ